MELVRDRKWKRKLETRPSCRQEHVHNHLTPRRKRNSIGRIQILDSSRSYQSYVHPIFVVSRLRDVNPSSKRNCWYNNPESLNQEMNIYNWSLLVMDYEEMFKEVFVQES